MRVLLTIFCGTVVLFLGSCAIVIGPQDSPIVVVMWGVVAANAVMIAGMWGLARPLRPLFVAMALADLATALILGGLTLAYAGNDQGLLQWGLALAALFLVKAGLGLAVALRM